MKTEVISIALVALLFTSASAGRKNVANSSRHANNASRAAGNLGAANDLALPYSGVADYSGPAFSITNQGHGDCSGIIGSTEGEKGKGIFGIAYSNKIDAANYGGYFQAEGCKGTGVYGEASCSNGVESYGGYFINKGNGYGVFGAASGGPNTGVFGINQESGYSGFLGTASFGVMSQGPLMVQHGSVYVTNSSGHPVMAMENWTEFWGKVVIRSRTSNNVILELGEGLDYAEGFNVTTRTEIPPGSVLIIDSDTPGKLKISEREYDKRVAGIVCGAKGNKSGVRLGVHDYDLDVALAGRVFCNVDAAYGEVRPGDLLTTSPIPGYAMVVKDYFKAQGSILGKAMESLARGQKRQILVLVTLQ